MYRGLQLLHDAYAAFKDSFLNGAMFDKLGQRIEGYLGCQLHQQIRGSDWFCMLYFRAGSGALSVLFPWMAISHGEPRLEHAVEMRGFGEVCISDVEAVIERLAGLLREQKQVNESSYR